MTEYISPVYVYRCRVCEAQWSQKHASGLGGPMCAECSTMAAEIVRLDYINGEVIEI